MSLANQGGRSAASPRRDGCRLHLELPRRPAVPWPRHRGHFFDRERLPISEAPQQLLASCTFALRDCVGLGGLGAEAWASPLLNLWRMLFQSTQHWMRNKARGSPRPTDGTEEPREPTRTSSSEKISSGAWTPIHPVGYQFLAHRLPRLSSPRTSGTSTTPAPSGLSRTVTACDARGARGWGVACGRAVRPVSGACRASHVWRERVTWRGAVR